MRVEMKDASDDADRHVLSSAVPARMGVPPMGTNADVAKPVDFEQCLQAMRRLDAFWAFVNEPPRHSHALPAGCGAERLP